MILATGSRGILQERRWKVIGSCRKTLEIGEHGSSIPTGNCPDFPQQIPANFLCFPVGNGRKWFEKSENFPPGILLPQNYRKTRELAGLFDLGCSVCATQVIEGGSDPMYRSDHLTWVAERQCANERFCNVVIFTVVIFCFFLFVSIIFLSLLRFYLCSAPKVDTYIYVCIVFFRSSIFLDLNIYSRTCWSRSKKRYI
jgi:hypothetical protein